METQINVGLYPEPMGLHLLDKETPQINFGVIWRWTTPLNVGLRREIHSVNFTLYVSVQM